jgi:uncharacterized FAD-dependent dehydrogenase
MGRIASLGHRWVAMMRSVSMVFSFHDIPYPFVDNLVRLLRNMRHDLEQRLGATILFGTKLTNIILDPDNPSVVQGIEVEQSQDPDDDNGSSQILNADAVVLATGHSARDVYETLATGSGGVCLEPKGFAVGFRIEHPQKVVTKIQYGNDWGKFEVLSTMKTLLVFMTLLTQSGYRTDCKDREASDRYCQRRIFRG